VQYLPNNGVELDDLRNYIEKTFDDTLKGKTVSSDAIKACIKNLDSVEDDFNDTDFQFAFGLSDQWFEDPRIKDANIENDGNVSDDSVQLEDYPFPSFRQLVNNPALLQKFKSALDKTVPGFAEIPEM